MPFEMNRIREIGESNRADAPLHTKIALVVSNLLKGVFTVFSEHTFPRVMCVYTLYVYRIQKPLHS